MSSYTWQHGLEFLREGRLDEAERVLREVIRGDTLSFEGHFYLGAVLTRQQRFEEAVEALRMAAQIVPDHVGARYNLGVVLEQTDDLAGAEQEYRAALQINPQHQKARQRLRALEVIHAARRQEAVAAATPGSWMSTKREEPIYSEEELEAADKSFATEQTIVRASVVISWGIGIAALFMAFTHVMGPFVGAIIVLPLLGPLIYLVAMDAYEWFSVNPKLAIPVSAVGIVLSILAVLFAIKSGVFGTQL